MKPLILTGLMGAGKTTVGRRAAARAGRRFVDTDHEVELEAGRSVAQIFADEGEEGFRARERRAIDRALEATNTVIAVGGGAVADADSRQALRSQGEVVWLTAPVGELARRLNEHSDNRPLLAEGAATETLTKLLSEREAAYRDCDRRVSTAGRSPDDVADAVLGEPISVSHGEHKYEVHVSSGGPEGCEAVLRRHWPDGGRMVVIADEVAAELHGDPLAKALTGAGFAWETTRFEPGENNKQIGSVVRVWGRMANAGVGRDAVVLAFGGGITSDVAGFVASGWKRGVSWVAVPTTLLGAVDASVGGKTGVNLPEGKNLVGAFHPPDAVFMPMAVLRTLPERIFAAGMAEVVKTALVGDPGLLDLLEAEADDIARRAPDVLEDVVRRAVRVKADTVSEDPWERSHVRRKLNLGHTAGHAIEASSRYAKFNHGEAVSLGTVLACRIAVQLETMDSGQAHRVERILARFGLPTDTTAWSGPGIERLRPPLFQDKKIASGKVRFILPQGLGSVSEVEMTPDELLGRIKQAAGATRGGHES